MSDGFSWYKRKPAKFIRGVTGLGPDVIGCYAVVLDLIYADEDSCPNDPAFIGGILGCSRRKARALVDRLLEIGKLSLNPDGRLVNETAEKELEIRAKSQRNAIETGAKGGRKSAENMSASNKNNGLIQGTVDHIEKNRIEKKPPSVPSGVRVEPSRALTLPLEVHFVELPTNRFDTTGEKFPIHQGHIAEYKTAYPAVDVEAELRAMRAWLLSESKKRKTYGGMLSFVNRWLARAQNQGGKGLAGLRPVSGGFPAPPVRKIHNVVAEKEQA